MQLGPKAWAPLLSIKCHNVHYRIPTNLHYRLISHARRTQFRNEAEKRLILALIELGKSVPDRAWCLLGIHESNPMNLVQPMRWNLQPVEVSVCEACASDVLELVGLWRRDNSRVIEGRLFENVDGFEWRPVMVGQS